MDVDLAILCAFSRFLPFGPRLLVATFNVRYSKENLHWSRKVNTNLWDRRYFGIAICIVTFWSVAGATAAQMMHAEPDSVGRAPHSSNSLPHDPEGPAGYSRDELSGSASVTPNLVQPGEIAHFVLAVYPATNPPSTGLSVIGDFSAIGGSAMQDLYDDGTNGDYNPGDLFFSWNTVMGEATGQHTVTLTVRDDQGRHFSTEVSITVWSASDTCATAIPLTIGTPHYTTSVGMTTDFGVPSCPSGSGETARQGVWFTFVGNGNLLNVTTCDSPSGAPATVLRVFTGSCQALGCTGAAGMSISPCTPATSSSVRICSMQGQLYYALAFVRLGSDGQYIVTVHDEGACPTNDTCDQARDIEIGEAIVTTNLGMTHDASACTTDQIRYGAWFRVTGNGRVLSFTTCGPTSGLDTRIEVYTGTCAERVCVGQSQTAEPACTSSQAARVRLCSILGAEYWILVGTDGQFPTSPGMFQLSVIDEGECPTNTACATAVSVPIGSTVPGHNANSMPQQVPFCGGYVTLENAVWFTFIGTGNRLNASTCGDTSGLDARITVFSGSCDNLTCIGANGDTQSTCTPASSTSVQFCSIAGQTYYALVNNPYGVTSAFSFSVQDEGFAPCFSGACCIDGTCAIYSQNGCAIAGGEFKGPGTTCDTLGPTQVYVRTHAFPGLVANGNCITSDIHIPASYQVADIEVHLSLPGPFPLENLYVQIRQPSGEWRTLYSGFCSGFGGLGAVFNVTDSSPVVCGNNIQGRIRSYQLEQVIGEDVQGTWTLQVCQYSMWFATLSSWSVRTREALPNPCLPAFCPTDWCADGSNDVPDIFCFLNSWFAGDEAAQNFGGTPGVPAIFAFITAWFAAGVGPCTP